MCPCVRNIRVYLNKHEYLNIHVCFKHRDKIELEYIIKGVEGLDNE